MLGPQFSWAQGKAKEFNYAIKTLAAGLMFWKLGIGVAKQVSGI